jgi:RimJ/RimL family protein N-acetyltransferase
MVPELRTERLLLRPLSIADEAQLQRVFPQWDVVRWLDAKVPWPYPDDGARYFLEQVALPQMAAGKSWHWSIRRQDAPEDLIGEITLQDVPDHHRGFWIDPAWHRQGFASEAADAVTLFWFEVLERPLLRVPKAAGNEASRRISLRQGMRVIDRFVGQLVSGPCEFELWELTREDWLAQRRSQSPNG